MKGRPSSSLLSRVLVLQHLRMNSSEKGVTIRETLEVWSFKNILEITVAFRLLSG